MSFWRFIFSFLYERNWHTGEKELSKTRVISLLLITSLLLVACGLIYLLRSPVEFSV